jgi:SP family general alpha glucoside:H+ symporter-like MFS transporter
LAIGFVATIIAWFEIVRFGRRRIFNTGLAFMVGIQLLIGILGE